MVEPPLCSSVPSDKYAQANTVQHWQLRDLIHVPDASGSLYFVRGGATRRLHTRTGEVETVQSYGVAPTAMTADHGYIAAGAQRGMLMIAGTDDGPYVYCGEVGGSVVNALHFGRDPRGKLRLFVSNNDRQLRIFDMPSMRPVDAICCPAPVNYSALSPDGTLLACVGDSEETHLYRAAPSGFVDYSSFGDATDAGMSCAWNSSGTCLASASQDGSLTIWDPRAHRRVAKLQTAGQEPGLSACRCVKFGNGPADLLAFNEHCSFTHVVDARNFQQDQIINIDAAIGGLPGEPCALSGLAFTPDGKRIYVGVEGSEMDMGPHGILAFDAHMLSRITFGVSDVALCRGAEYKNCCTPGSNYGHSRLVNACIHFGTITPSSFSELVHPLSEEVLVLAIVMSALRRNQCSLAQNFIGCATQHSFPACWPESLNAESIELHTATWLWPQLLLLACS